MTGGTLLSAERCSIIAEVALAHDGSLGAAHAFIDAVAGAGADAVKFQTHIAEAESTQREAWRVKFSYQDENRYDYWRRTAFSEAQWHGLAEHAATRNIHFLSSPFSIEAFELLERIGVAAWKVASGELMNVPLLERMAANGRPILLSSGLSPFEELDRAVQICRRHGAEVAVMQTTTQYPCPPERLGLNLLDVYRQRYGCPVGLSDHSGTIYAGLGAVTLGASVLEVHVTFSRESFGPDVPASLTIAELRQLVEGVQFLERALHHPIDKDGSVAALAHLRALFGRSIVAARDLPAGAILEATDLALKKPGGNMPPERLAQLPGRRLIRALQRDEPLRDVDLS